MQLFLPFADLSRSVKSLDKRRLWKQILEADQIINGVGWSNHPVIKMYRNNEYTNFAIAYYNTALNEFVSERNGSTKYMPFVINSKIVYPPWWGNERFHQSHRSNLLRKAVNEKTELLTLLGIQGITLDNTPTDLPYVWPLNEN